MWFIWFEIYGLSQTHTHTQMPTHSNTIRHTHSLTNTLTQTQAHNRGIKTTEDERDRLDSWLKPLASKQPRVPSPNGNKCSSAARLHAETRHHHHVGNFKRGFACSVYVSYYVCGFVCMFVCDFVCIFVCILVWDCVCVAVCGCVGVWVSLLPNYHKYFCFRIRIYSPVRHNRPRRTICQSRVMITFTHVYFTYLANFLVKILFFCQGRFENSFWPKYILRNASLGLKALDMLKIRFLCSFFWRKECIFKWRTELKVPILE